MLFQLIELIALLGKLLLEGLESARIDWLLSDRTRLTILDMIGRTFPAPAA